MRLIDKAQNLIKEMILKKQYDKDGFLPAEGQLCEKLQMSRSTVREAVQSLEVRGFVERIHGKGIKVVDTGLEVMTRSLFDLMEKQDISLFEIMQLRQIIETHSAALATANISDEMIVEMEQQIKIMESLPSTDNKYIDADFKFHYCIAKATKNNLILAIVSAYEQLMKKLIAKSSQQSISIELKFGYHRHVLEAIKNRDPKAAKEAMERHLTATEEYTFNN